jgi:hypothetical protein
VAAFAGMANPAVMTALARASPSPAIMRFMTVLSVVLGVVDPDQAAHVRRLKRKLSYSIGT